MAKKQPSKASTQSYGQGYVYGPSGFNAQRSKGFNARHPRSPRNHPRSNPHITSKKKKRKNNVPRVPPPPPARPLTPAEDSCWPPMATSPAPRRSQAWRRHRRGHADVWCALPTGRGTLLVAHGYCRLPTP